VRDQTKLLPGEDVDPEMVPTEGGGEEAAAKPRQEGKIGGQGAEGTAKRDPGVVMGHCTHAVAPEGEECWVFM
jgi:hypothetical protein